jgi:hypothetical protein
VSAAATASAAAASATGAASTAGATSAAGAVVSVVASSAGLLQAVIDRASTAEAIRANFMRKPQVDGLTTCIIAKPIATIQTIVRQLNLVFLNILHKTINF